MRQLRSVPPDLSVMPIRNRNCRRCRSPRRLAIRVLGGPCPKAKVAPCIAHQAGYTAFTHEF